MKPKSLDSHIEVTPGVCGGRPRIAGHRIAVENIAFWHERQGKTAAEIALEYNLDRADVHAALAYYFDHRAEIDRRSAEDTAFVEELRKKTPSVLQQKLREMKRNGGTNQVRNGRKRGHGAYQGIAQTQNRRANDR